MTLFLVGLATLPWVAVLLYARFRVRLPRPLPSLEGAAGSGPGSTMEGVHDLDGDRVGSGSGGGAGSRDRAGYVLPFVSVIVPARNEAATIETCLRHLTASRYPAFEIVVVDDRSGDETASLAGAVPPGNAEGVRVVPGQPLPDGWLGKPWACWQGYHEAGGDLLLFTDADTRHGPDLLERAVRALEEDDANVVTLMGRQLMESFWEKMIQPQLFAALVMRFPDPDRVLETGACGDAVANGQFILLGREAYESVDGHQGVRGEVVEDLRLARRLCRNGHRLTLREAEDAFATRMYRSLSQIVEGWSKNLAIALRQSVSGILKPLVLPLSVSSAIILWLLPPVILMVGGIHVVAGGGGLGGAGVGPGVGPGGGAGAAGLGWSGWLPWSVVVVGLSVVFWTGAARRSRIHPGWGLLYPLGSAITCFLLIRSWIRGRTVEWKGRVYRVESIS